MNTDVTLQISVENLAETEQIAKKLAKYTKGGEVIEFISDLGGGKTTFVKSYVKALGSLDHVSSPTFTVSKEYTASNMKILHYDFYRLDNPGLVADMLEESLDDSKTVSLIEWGGSVKGVLPKNRLVITIVKDAQNDQGRVFTFTCPKETEYLLQGLYTC